MTGRNHENDEVKRCERVDIALLILWHSEYTLAPRTGELRRADLPPAAVSP